MTAEPSLVDTLLAALAAGQARVETSSICRVNTYDRLTRTAEVQEVQRRPYRDADGAIAFEDPLVLSGVPVSFALLTWDLAVGSFVTVVFVSRSIDEWKLTGDHGQRPVDYGRRHDLTDAIAFPGVLSPGGAFSPTAVAAGAAVLEHPDIRLGGSGASIYVALADYVDARIAAVVAGHNTHTHPSGVGPTGVPTTPIADQATTACTTTKAL